MYPVVQVSEGASELPEQLGTKPKFWFHSGDGSRWLFKEGRQNSGEHWAEKAAAEIAELLGLPHAIYELAEWRGRVGVVSRSFVPQGARLVLGNEVLAKVIPEYPQHLSRFWAREHRVSSVLALLREPGVALPIQFEGPKPLERAADVFVGIPYAGCAGGKPGPAPREPGLRGNATGADPSRAHVRPCIQPGPKRAGCCSPGAPRHTG